MFAGRLPDFQFLPIPLKLCASPSVLPRLGHWVVPPLVTCWKLLRSLRCRSVFFFSWCLSVGVSLTAGIKEPLHTGCAAYLRQQPCQWDYFKWELERNCRRGFGRTLAVSYYIPVPWRVAGKREGFPLRPPADADGTVSLSGYNLALSRFQ